MHTVHKTKESRQPAVGGRYSVCMCGLAPFSACAEPGPKGTLLVLCGCVKKECLEVYTAVVLSLFQIVVLMIECLIVICRDVSFEILTSG